MERVLLPRYDLSRRISSVLKADCLTLLDEETIAGRQVAIHFFNPDQSQRGEVLLQQATFYQSRGSLEAIEDVRFKTDQLRARSAGLIYAFERGEGWLHGPVFTWIQTARPTAMHPSSVAIGVAAAATLATANPVTQVQPPAPPNTAERQALDHSAASCSPAHSAATLDARSNLSADLDSASAATEAARSFLDENPPIASTPSNPTASRSPAAPLEIPTTPEDTQVNCERGMYFDSENGIFVYLGNVTVKDPRFELTGADELKIFLEKQPANTAATNPTPPKTNSPSSKGPRFGDVERIIASGAVRIIQKQPQPGKQPVEASGGLFTFHPKSGEIFLTGRYPWVKQGSTYLRANEPNLILRIQKSGSFVTEGNWDMGGKFNSAEKP